MSVVVRFAPSPTGRLHIGNARTALITWLFARHNNGKFILRIDDTDVERSKDEYVDNIKSGLTWLNMNWDDHFHQRGRENKYNAAIEKLKSSGRLYACYETSDELALKRKSLLSRGLPPIYDRGALSLSDEEVTAYEAEGRQPHWRFKLNHTPIKWSDHIRGDVEFNGDTMSDPVLIREDGTPLYHICSVVDDIDAGVTHVVRGEDHVANTAAHIQMFEALDAQAPEFAHLTMLAGAGGEKLSKRIGSLSLTDLRDIEKVEPMSLVSLLSRIGTSDPIEAISDISTAIENFNFSKFSRNMPKFDLEELFRLNAKILHETNFSDVKDRLIEAGLTQVDEAFWNIARANISKLSDIEEWVQVAKGPVTPIIEDADFAKAAAKLLPESPWDRNTWDQWIKAVKTETDRKGKNLFMPIRCALTGKQHGPELRDLLPLIGRERALERLNAA